MSAAHTSKIKIYDLAKELKMESKRLIEEVRREGVDVSVPSNTISKELAEKIRNKYFPKKEPTVQRSIRVVKKAKPAEGGAAHAPEPAEARQPAPDAAGGSVRPLAPRILRPRREYAAAANMAQPLLTEGAATANAPRVTAPAQPAQGINLDASATKQAGPPAGTPAEGNAVPGRQIRTLRLTDAARAVGIKPDQRVQVQPPHASTTATVDSPPKGSPSGKHPINASEISAGSLAPTVIEERRPESIPQGREHGSKSSSVQTLDSPSPAAVGGSVTSPKPAPLRDPYRLTGDVFGKRYRIEGFAGSGSFGAVYRATDIKIERTVAVKILKPDIKEADLAVARELFKREALTVCRLRHPNIIIITDADEESDLAYMVMEWLEGRTLEDELSARRLLPPEEVAELLEQMADALQTAHNARVIHRDIKPSNIHLGRYRRAFAKILDFGIAKVVNSSSAAAVSRVAGTLYYMSPEQLTGSYISHLTDIYSLGVMLYQMLTGSLPFTGTNQAEILNHHISTAPPPLKNVRPELASVLSPVIQKALSKNPGDRQASAHALYSEFINALNSV